MRWESMTQIVAILSFYLLYLLEKPFLRLKAKLETGAPA